MIRELRAHKPCWVTKKEKKKKEDDPGRRSRVRTTRQTASPGYSPTHFALGQLNMEQQTDSKSGKEYVTAVYCHPAYSTYQRRQWHPTPVLLLGKSHGRGNLLGCSPWGCKESDGTEQLHSLTHSFTGHSMASGQTTGREHNPTHQQNIGLKIY